MTKIITRAEAAARNLTRYFTGKPCKHGHVAERHTRNWTCTKCAGAYVRNWQRANPEKERERDRARDRSNRKQRKRG